VVATNDERIRDVSKDAPTVVCDQTRSPVQEFGRDEHPSAEGFGERLVTETDTQQGHVGLAAVTNDL
jgi:hypothetical protein